MEVDEQTETIEASNVAATVNMTEIASSSRGTPLAKERPENDKNTNSSGEVKTNSSEPDGAEVCRETISQDVEEDIIQRETHSDIQEVQNLQEENNTINDNVDEEEQNEQHIENAGIDPNYPLVLVQRVSVPPSGDGPTGGLVENNNQNPVVMDQDNAVVERAHDMASRNPPPEVIALFNSISSARSDIETDDEDDEEDDEDIEDSWSDEDEDEALFLQNPNFRGFANQFEAIRNMIAHTRRSMSEAESNFGPIPRNSIMQRFRRILFILNNRRRRLIHVGLNSTNFAGSTNAEVAPRNEGAENPRAGAIESVPNNGSINMTMEQEEEMNENAVRFDTNLPAEHLYMGENMNRVSGVNYLEVDQHVKLRLFTHQHVLFPGEVLPFMVNSSTNIMEGDIDAQNGILFGVCFPCLSNKPTANGDASSSTSDDKDQFLYGVTCQIYELGEDNRSNTMIKSRALQRFVTKANDLTVPLEYINAHPRMKCFGFVKILPDIYLPDPLKCINMGSTSRFRDNTSMQNMYKRFQAATTPWPAHVYETHNILNIIEKARTQLAQHKINTMPSDPTQLSYWLVRNLHVPEEMLKPVFLADTVNTRFKLIASTFKREAIFSCRNCVAHIADCRELFAMSKHGVQSQYCNSAGYIHETNTLYQVIRQNILYSGSPSTEFSWFPGYQWQIIICKICNHHLGWEFKAVEPNLIPKQFFGISSSSVRVRLAQDRNNIPAASAVYVNFLRLMNAGMSELHAARI